jgi:hypothetical protein
MESRAQPERFQLFGAVVEAVGNPFPAIEAIYFAGAGHDDELASDDLVQVDGFGKVLRGE